MGGYIKIPRDLFDDADFSGEKFSKREAFLDLVQMAAHKPTTSIWKGRACPLERGQVITSRRFLSARWRWSVGRVHRFIDSLCDSGRCFMTLADGHITVLTIADYDSFNGDAQPKPRAERSGKANDDKDGVEEAINRIYAIYPTKCPVSGRGTGKSSKDKKKIEILLRTRTEEEIAETIRQYLSDCAAHQSYIKNFSTFLNNFPDYGNGKADATEGPQFSDPGAYIGEDGLTHTATSYKTVRELDEARMIREAEYERWKQSNGKK